LHLEYTRQLIDEKFWSVKISYDYFFIFTLNILYYNHFFCFENLDIRLTQLLHNLQLLLMRAVHWGQHRYLLSDIYAFLLESVVRKSLSSVLLIGLFSVSLFRDTSSESLFDSYRHRVERKLKRVEKYEYESTSYSTRETDRQTKMKLLSKGALYFCSRYLY